MYLREDGEREMCELISVIVPVFNVSAYLKQCVESIRNQTYRELEIILVDDGSTDDSGLICDEYMNLDSRIKVLHQENSGLVSARNAGLRIATGKYVGFVDSDDYIEPDMYEKLCLALENYDVDFVESKFDQDGIKPCMDVEDGVIDFNEVNRSEYICKKILEKQEVIFSLCTKLFRAELIKEASYSRPSEQSYGEDVLCLCRYILKCNRFYLCNDVFYHYRIRQDSISHPDWITLCVEEAKLFAYIMDFFRENDLLHSCGFSEKKHYLNSLLYLFSLDGQPLGIHGERYHFPDVKLLRDKNIVIYGAGRVGKDYYSQISKYECCYIAAWIDSNWEELQNKGINVGSIDQLFTIEYDYVVIAVKNQEKADEIKEQLQEMGIDNSKVIWETPIQLR